MRRIFPDPGKLETWRGFWLALWALSVLRVHDFEHLQFYDHLAGLVSWIGAPQLVWGGSGLAIGGTMMLAGELEVDVARRASAIAAIGYWFLVASGFAEASPTLPATVVYLAMGALNSRTALGLRAK